MTIATVTAHLRPPGDLVAETIARMCETADRIRAGNQYMPDGAPIVGPLSLLIADSRLLTRLVPAVRPTMTVEEDEAASRALLEDVHSRLWMVAR